MALPRYVPHYTLSDYEAWEGRWELWNGLPVAISPSPGRRHQEVASNLLFAMWQALLSGNCERCKVLYEIDWRISSDTVVRPDLLIVCDHKPSNWIEETPQFIAEILSDSTRERDLTYKREMYQKLGVAYYLVIDPEVETFQLFWNARAAYQESANLALNLSQTCRVTVDLDGLFA